MENNFLVPAGGASTSHAIAAFPSSKFLPLVHRGRYDGQVVLRLFERAPAGSPEKPHEIAKFPSRKYFH